MKFRTASTQKAITVIATLTATIAVAATVFAPASFGSNRLKLALWESDPIILAVPPTVTPGSTVDCAVAFEDAPEPCDPVDQKKATIGTTSTTDTKNVTVYSDPPGAISYSGTVSGSGAVIPIYVSATAAPGPVTVYCETEGSAPISTNTTVVSN